MPNPPPGRLRPRLTLHVKRKMSDTAGSPGVSTTLQAVKERITSNQALSAFLLYLALSILIFGRHAVRYPSVACVCGVSNDPGSYMWAFVWWPHALVHGLNPFFTHYLWTSSGVNVAQGAMVPTAALLMFPVTELFGPVVTYNALSILGPALGAFTTFLLCRRLIDKPLPALAAGYLFGFSSYEILRMTGNLNLVLTFLIPLMVLVALRRLDGELSRRVYIPLMAALFLMQAGFSTEQLGECVLLGGVMLIAGLVVASRTRRGAVVRLLVDTILAGFLALAVGAPFFYYALFAPGFPTGSPTYSDQYGLNVLSFFVPESISALGHNTFAALSFTFEGSGGYFSLPLVLAFMAWLANPRPRRKLAIMVGVGTVVSLIGAFGSHLRIAGFQTIPLPFQWVNEVRGFNELANSRLVLFTGLAVSIGLAAWLSSPSQGKPSLWWRWAVIAVGVVLLFPDVTYPSFDATINNPPFFSTHLYRRYLRPGETVLVLPFGGNDMSMLWQAEDGFSYYMPEGYISSLVPEPLNAVPAVGQMLGNEAPSAPALREYISAHYVSHIVVDPSRGGPWTALLASMGLRGQSVGGIVLYAIPHAPRVAARRPDLTRPGPRQRRQAGCCDPPRRSPSPSGETSRPLQNPKPGTAPAPPQGRSGAGGWDRPRRPSSHVQHVG